MKVERGGLRDDLPAEIDEGLLGLEEFGESGAAGTVAGGGEREGLLGEGRDIVAELREGGAGVEHFLIHGEERGAEFEAGGLGGDVDLGAAFADFADRAGSLVAHGEREGDAGDEAEIIGGLDATETGADAEAGAAETLREAELGFAPTGLGGEAGEDGAGFEAGDEGGELRDGGKGEKIGTDGAEGGLGLAEGGGEGLAADEEFVLGMFLLDAEQGEGGKGAVEFGARGDGGVDAGADGGDSLLGEGERAAGVGEALGIGDGLGEPAGDIGEDIEALGLVVGVGEIALALGGGDTAGAGVAEIDGLAELEGGFEGLDAGEGTGAEEILGGDGEFGIGAHGGLRDAGLGDAGFEGLGAEGGIFLQGRGEGVAQRERRGRGGGGGGGQD